MAEVYTPSRSVGARISRRLTPLRARNTLHFSLSRPVISFTFDDCPRSVIAGGMAPLEAEGWRSTLYIAGGLLGTHNHHGEQMVWEDVRNAQASGHEIGCHGFSHTDGSQMKPADVKADIIRNQRLFETEGLLPAPTYAYPFGQTTATLKNDLGQAFEGLRGIKPGVMLGQADLNEIKSTALFTGERVKTAIKQIQSLKTKPGWLTFFTHDIRENPSEWGCTEDEFRAVIAAVKSVNAHVLPVSSAIAHLKAQS